MFKNSSEKPAFQKGGISTPPIRECSRIPRLVTSGLNPERKYGPFQLESRFFGMKRQLSKAQKPTFQPKRYLFTYPGTFLLLESVLRIRSRDPGSSAFLTPGSAIHFRDGKKSGSGTGIRYEHPGSYHWELCNNFLGLKINNFCVADPGSGALLTWSRDLGRKNRIQDRCHKSSS
jgi:hypothetical protein